MADGKTYQPHLSLACAWKHSPEQVKGANADVRTDVFNLGRLYYRLLTGVSAFDGRDESVETLRLFIFPTKRFRSSGASKRPVRGD